VESVIFRVIKQSDNYYDELRKSLTSHIVPLRALQNANDTIISQFAPELNKPLSKIKVRLEQRLQTEVQAQKVTKDIKVAKL
jgi:hypothetical protein